ncbi:MAG: hypothetical protein JJE50_06525 [Actinomycetales bacterium]|nr:hypothetical protein [Actinomycetales bacterium]
MSEPDAVPPTIAGYVYVRPIGHGGFSDVYLYQQLMPRREVAIKVLRPVVDLTEGTVLLVAAPEGYFVNRAASLEIASSSASLITILILSTS